MELWGKFSKAEAKTRMRKSAEYDPSMNNRGWGLRVGEQRGWGHHFKDERKSQTSWRAENCFLTADVINNDGRLSEKGVVLRPKAPDTVALSQLSRVNASSQAHTHFNERVIDVNSSYNTENWAEGACQ